MIKITTTEGKAGTMAAARTTARQQQQTPQQEKAQPKPVELPEAKFELGEKRVPYFFPQATLSDGTVVSCGHKRYGHESAKTAAACIKAVIAAHKHSVAK